MNKLKDNWCPCCEFEKPIFDCGVCKSCYYSMCDWKYEENTKDIENEYFNLTQRERFEYGFKIR
jgi:hypothetical protein|tara:strand:+ start:1193 stop:1384 length:192 start_codon:yes stop_codon:yes gene_type:complete